MDHPPSTSETAFDCPLCGTFAAQTWYDSKSFQLSSDARTPVATRSAITETWIAAIKAAVDLKEEVKSEIIIKIRNKIKYEIYFLRTDPNNEYTNRLHNLWISECFNCNRLSLWGIDSLLHPARREGALPSEDMPGDVRTDYEEARTILNVSPRGSAALLRLAIQKLMIHLGEPGVNINDDIASLVRKGLEEKVRMALDAVRVIGNEAVHPGLMDLRDDRDTVLTLLNLINHVVAKMITGPKEVETIYSKLPEPKRKAIDQRDGRK